MHILIKIFKGEIMAKMKTAIQFGLVYIPITLHSCTKNSDIGFNMIYKKTGQRIKYNKTCEDCPAKIEQEDIVKGYQYERDKYVTLTDEEFKKLKTAKDENIEILQFSKLDEIDPILYEDSYYIEPTGAKNAFVLLVKALEGEKKVGIAKTVLGTTETLIAIRVIDGLLVLSKLHFADEIQDNPVQKPKETVKKEELDLAKRLIANMTKSFDVKSYKNEYKERIVKAIEDKIAGQKIHTIKSPQKPQKIINLMDALKQSVRQTGKDDQKEPDDDQNKVVTIRKRA